MKGLWSHDEPLGLPRGSVRAVLTLLLVSPVPALVILGMLGRAVNTEVLAFYSVIVMLVVRDYFGARTNDTTVSVVKEEAATGAVDA